MMCGIAGLTGHLFQGAVLQVGSALGLYSGGIEGVVVGPEESYALAVEAVALRHGIEDTEGFPTAHPGTVGAILGEGGRSFSFRWKG